MRVLIVGGSGYVGSLIVPGLAEAGHLVRVLDPVEPAGDVAVEWACGSALDPAALSSALAGVDAVVFTALGPRGADGDFDVRSSYETNVAAVHLTLAAAGAARVRRAVLISSISVFANVPTPVTDRLLDERSVPDSADAYGLVKRLAETVAEAAAAVHQLTVSALRIAWPTTEAAWPLWALPIFDSPAEIRCLDGTLLPSLAASDLASAVLAALDRSDPGFEAFHIVGDDGSGRCWSTAKARDLLGWQPRRR
ncbi:NAD-dependent epimerase/dehydratase family protein [Catenulispora pinisilvae]|nr:NAD(P)-dependent oxidoreductase [Catenulispora pinisilvae]